MPFPGPPRAWSPVLSISTRREEMDSLRAQIDAANTQQKVNMRQSQRPWQQPKVYQVPTVLDHVMQEDPKTPLYRNLTMDSWSDAATLTTSVRHKTLGNTIKGELSNAKQIIKGTSKKQLRRLRTCASRSGAGKHTQSDSNLEIPEDLCAIAELSSDPPMPQLEDTQKHSKATTPARYNHACDETLHAASETSCGGFDTAELCNKSYSCDGCRLNLTGKDFYDFCPGCHSAEGILCMACASSGGCQRHRQESTTSTVLPSLCTSPAPSYDHEFGLFQDRKDSSQPANLTAGLRPRAVLPSADLDAVIEETSEDRQAHEMKVPSSTSSVRRAADEKPAVIAQLQHDFMSEVIELSRKQEKLSSLHALVNNQEASLRDQQAALREQQISLREEALLLKEREYLARERDATLIRHLQAFALESLSRGQHIGAQFHVSKCDEDDAKPATPVERARSNASHASEISLESSPRNVRPDKSLSELTANTKALIETINAEDKIVQAYSEKRKKGGQSAKAGSSMTATGGTTVPSNRALSKSQNKELRGSDTDDDEGELAPVKKQKTTPPHDETSRRSFACPYCKFDPERYSTRNNNEMKYRSCGSHYLPTIPRVKQHLQRVHWRPNNHCQRCYKSFSSPAELIEHSRQQESCLMEDCPFPEKMDTEQKRQIHVKRPNTPPETLWYDIYKILFPNSTPPDSPYADEHYLPTPTSAAPSTANSDGTSHLLRDAFNEELNKYADQFDQAERNLLNQVLEDAMSTVLQSTPVTPSRSPRTKPSRTPSIVISPVTPSPMSQTHLTVPSSFPAGGAYPPRRAGCLAVKKMVSPDVPQLQQPERQSLAPALDKTVAASATRPSDAVRHQRSANRIHGTSLLTVEPQNALSPLPLPMPKKSVDPQQELHATGVNVPTALLASLTETPSASFDLMNGTYHNEYSDGDHVRDAGFEWQSQPPIPLHVLEDTGYGDECNSYDKDDDKYAMQTMVPLAYSNKYGNLGYSPIDSGYGSGNSMRPRLYDTLTSINVEGEKGAEFLEYGIDPQQNFIHHQHQQLDFSQYPGAIGRAM